MDTSLLEFVCGFESTQEIADRGSGFVVFVSTSRPTGVQIPHGGLPAHCRL